MDKKDFHKLVSAIYGVTHNVDGRTSYLFAAKFVEEYLQTDDEALGVLYRTNSELTNDRLLLGTHVIPKPVEEYAKIIFNGGYAYTTPKTYSWLEELSRQNSEKSDVEGKVVIEVEKDYIHHYFIAFWHIDETGELRKCRKEVLVGDMSEALDYAQKRIRTGMSRVGFRIP